MYMPISENQDKKDVQIFTNYKKRPERLENWDISPSVPPRKSATVGLQ